MQSARSVTIKIAIFIAFLVPTFIFAAPLYQPGETLNPSCLPSDVDCTVATSTETSSFNTSGTSGGYKIDGNLILQASSTNFSTLVGRNTGAALLADGYYNTAIGYEALKVATSSDFNTAVGFRSLYLNTTGSSNTALGYNAGRFIADGSTANNTTSNSVFLGYNTKSLTNADTNQIVIGHTATGLGSNSAVLGNDSITKTVLKGNVGIGTTSPLAKLAITGNGLSTGRAFEVADSANSPKFTILDNGNVGVGTVSPDKLVEIVGGADGVETDLLQIRSNFTSAGTGSTLKFVNSTSAANDITSGELSVIRQATGADMAFRVGNGAAMTERLTIVGASGNVGIGTSTPSSKLTITGPTPAITSHQMLTLYSSDAMAADKGGSIGFGGNYTTGGAHAGWASIAGLKENSTTGSLAGYLQFGTRSSAGTNAEVMRISSTGNLGLGTTSPYTKLSVVGDIVATNITATSSFDTSGTSGGYKIDGNMILQSSTTNSSTLLGRSAGAALLADGYYNTALGYQALITATSSDYNTAVGYRSLYLNTTGASNTASGYSSLYNNTTGTNNTTSGHSSMYSNTTGSYNTASGYASLYSNTTGSNNTASGYSALYANTTGNYNVANGTSALRSNTTGSTNTATGYATLYKNITGSSNTANGYASLYLNTTGSNNVANGVNSLYNNTTGSYNTASGYSALNANTTGNYNIAIGRNSLLLNTTGSLNVALGSAALQGNSTGANNTASGYASMYGNLTGVGNTANGMYSLYYATSSIYSTAIGYLAGVGSTLTASDYNSAVDTYMTFIGMAASRDNNNPLTTALTNSTAIGYNAKVGGSNMMVLGNGVNVGIGTTSPYAKLSVTNTGTGPSFVVEDSTSPDTTPFIVDASGLVGIGTVPTTLGKLEVSDSATTNSYGVSVIKTQSNTVAYQSGINSTFTSNQTSSAFSGVNSAVNAQMFIGGSNTQNWTGAQTAEATGGVAAILGHVEGRSGWSGTVSNASSFLASNEFSSTGGGVITNLSGFRIMDSIGTLAPVNQYGVYVNALSKGSTSNYGLYFGGAQSSGSIGSAASTHISLMPGTGGNVGIGTTTPSTKLQLYDATTGSTLNVRNSIGNGNGATILIGASRGSIATPSDVINGDSVGVFDTEAYSGGTWFSSAMMKSNVDGTFTSGQRPPSSLTFFTNNANAARTEKLRITSGGNLGLGTTTPSAKLSITQSANTSAGGLWIAETGNTDFRSAYMDTSGILSFYGGDTAGALNTATLNAAGAWTNASDRSYKENIVDLGSKYGLSTVIASQPRFYTMKGTHLPQVGFIAQELKALVPEVVDGKDGSMGISYGNLVAVAFQAIKDLSAKVDGLAANALASVKSLFVDDIEVKNKLTISGEICVDDICISKEQFKKMLENAGGEEKPKENNDKPKNETSKPQETSTTTATTTPIVKEEPKKEEVKVETSKIETPEVEEQKPEAVVEEKKEEAPKSEVIKEEPKEEVVKVEEKKEEVKPETPKVEVSKIEAPKTEEKKEEKPSEPTPSPQPQTP